jgi:hypothetical protein
MGRVAHLHLSQGFTVARMRPASGQCRAWPAAGGRAGGRPVSRPGQRARKEKSRSNRSGPTRDQS